MTKYRFKFVADEPTIIDLLGHLVESIGADQALFNEWVSQCEEIY